ncbi:MAG: GNAT family N-acetyltransferase [Paracoccaceae bacterium]
MPLSMTVVAPIDLGSEVEKQKIIELQRHAFGDFGEDLFDHILRDTPRGAVGYGIHDEGHLVAFNAFMGHSAHRAGQTGIAYQSCMSATHKEHGGRGYFSKIIRHAQEDLKACGGAFIFGFPNHNSGPIFVKKLGFTLAENRPCFFLRSPVGLLGQPNGTVLLQELVHNRSVTFDMREAAAWKSAKDDSFFEMDHLTNYVFGKVQCKTIKGVPVRLMVIGGYEINKPHQAGRLIGKAMRQVDARIARTNANVHGPLARSCRLRRSVAMTEPTIAYPLNWDVEAQHVEACGGIKDVY